MSAKPLVLVLGGNGFLGTHVVNRLQKCNYTVQAASRRNGLDLTDKTSTEKFFSSVKPAYIINCAAHVGSLHYVTTYAGQVFSDNTQMALNLYNAVATYCPTAVIVNPLSNCSYPGNADIQTESQWFSGPAHDSVLSYGNAKRFIFVTAKCFEKQHKIRSINFLVPNTFGPGDYTDPNKTHALNGMIIRMIEAHKNASSEFEIWGTGSPIREWTYIDDVVDTLVASLERTDLSSDPVNIGQKHGYTIKESAEFIAEALNYKGTLVFNTKFQDGAPVKILDNEKFRSLFPNFIFYDHKKGIANTVAYYQSILKN